MYFPFPFYSFFFNVVSPCNGSLVAVFEFSASKGEHIPCERDCKGVWAERKWLQKNPLGFLGLGWAGLGKAGISEVLGRCVKFAEVFPPPPIIAFACLWALVMD